MATEYTETFEQILNDTVPQTPGIIRSVALRELRLAAREFFERSYAWTVLVEDISVAAGNTLTQVDDGDANTEVIGILGVSFNGQDIPPAPTRPSRLGQDPAFTTSDVPKAYFLTSNPDEFSFFPFLENTDGNNANPVTDVLVALVPSFTATDLPRQITLKYYDAIVEGYLSRVYLHPNKPYSAPALAGQMRHSFKRRIGFYMAQRKQGYNNSQAWCFPRGWGVQRLGGNG